VTDNHPQGREEISVKKTIMHKLSIMKSKRVALLQTALVIGVCSISMGAVSAAAQVLSLETAVGAAQANDPWLVENRYSQDAVEARSISEGVMPEPRFSAGLANFPTDTFDIDQEPMTQITFGVTQTIPRGDTLRIRREQLRTMGRQYPFQRLDRQANTVVTVSRLWLEAYKAQQSIALIEKDRSLFIQLADIAEAGYSATLGRARQQDIVRAQLELTRLDDRLTVLKQKQEMALEELSEWVSGYFREEYLGSPSDGRQGRPNLELPRDLPDIPMLNEPLYTGEREADPQVLYGYFIEHPAVQAIKRKIEANNLGIDLARERYKPLWGVSAVYGYRDDPPSGDRADFISFGVSFDLPILTKNRPEQELQSAVSEAEAVKTQKWSLIRKMIAGFEKNKTQLRRLKQRQQLYQKQLLPQVHEQSEAYLTAYTNYDGDFAEVVRARIAELNAQLDALDIDVEMEKTIINLNYYFMKSAEDILVRNQER